jgi:hypothetical protein
MTDFNENDELIEANNVTNESVKRTRSKPVVVVVNGKAQWYKGATMEDMKKVADFLGLEFKLSIK